MRTGATTPFGTEARLVSRLARLVSRVSGVQGFAFIFVALVATGFALAFTQQGLDIVGAAAARGGGEPAALQLGWLCATTFFLGFQGWFWARACVEEQVGPRSLWRGNPVLVWVPRVFALIPFGFLIQALRSITFGAAPWGVWFLVVSGALLLVFTIVRQDLILRLRRHAERLRAGGHPRKAGALDAALNRLRPFLMGAGLVVWGAFLVLFIIDPVSIPLQIGPCAIVLLATALIIPVMTTAIQLGRKVGLRATEWVFVVILVVGSLVDNHAVRLLPTAAPLPARDDVPTAYATWRSQASVVGGWRPIIFVAIAGGASRAGFWSGEVLSQLEEMSGGEFSRHTFAISSVSGGSVGAVGFLASLTDPAPRLPLHTRVGDFTGRDFLSPAFAAGAFPDLFQRIFPAPVLPDRGEALERGFEVGWTQHCRAIGGCQDPELLQRGFLSRWGGTGRWSPILAIDGVHEETGNPILTSSVRLTTDVTAVDFSDTTQSDVRLSTAISNGARFPYISPPGTYSGFIETGPKDHPVMKRVKFGHIVDGGYFDAAGVETIRELARNLFAKLDDASSRDLKPIYVVISNTDPADPVDPRRKPTTADLAPDIFGPLRGLFAAGGAHGALLSRTLDQDPPRTTNTAGDAAPQVIAIHLCQRGAPMDWVLSKASVDFMRQQLGTSAYDPCGNYARMVALVGQLRGDARGDGPNP